MPAGTVICGSCKGVLAASAARMRCHMRARTAPMRTNPHAHNAASASTTQVLMLIAGVGAASQSPDGHRCSGSLH
jgi:hypothetical protein